MPDLNAVFGLRGKTAVVTGGASGIGLAITRCLSDAGARVVAVGSRPAEAAEPALADLGPAVSYARFDLTDTGAAGDFARRVLADAGQVDVLVNNAGAHCKKSLEDMTVDDFRRVLDVNLVGAFALTRAFAPHMKERKSGSIVFMASMASFIGLGSVAGYCSAKSGLLGLVRNLAVDLSPFAVRANAVAPGWIDTDMFRGAVAGDPARMEKILGRIPMHEPGKPEDIGYAVVYLASDASRYVNGVCLPVDGGALVNL